MLRSPSIRRAALLAVALATPLAGCGGAPPAGATTPAQVDIAPAPPPSAEADATPPAKGAAAAKPKDAASEKRPTSLPGTSIRFTGGDGSSIERAIIILGAKGESDGVDSEYQYLSLVYGPKGSAWDLVTQSLLDHGGRQFDAMELTVGAEHRTVYFDITAYFGKF